MYIPFWIILAGTIIWYLFFYKKRISPQQAKELIAEKVTAISVTTKARLENSHLKEFLDYEKHFFLTMEENYLRLAERFKHDNVQMAQIVKDWIDYNEIINGLIYQRELLDVATTDEQSEQSDQNTKKLQIKRQEIETRYKSLLGKQYNDPLDIFKKKK